MPWTNEKYPNSLKNLSVEVRHKAIEVANALLDEHYDEGHAIAIATVTAKKWADRRDDHPDGDRLLHVMPHPHGWAIRRTDAARASFVLDTLDSAYEKAVDIARAENLDLVLHEESGDGERYLSPDQ